MLPCNCVIKCCILVIQSYVLDCDWTFTADLLKIFSDPGAGRHFFFKLTSDPQKFFYRGCSSTADLYTHFWCVISVMLPFKVILH